MQVDSGSRRRLVVAAGWLLLLAAVCPATARAACQVNGDPVAFGTVDLSQRSTGTGRVVVSCDASTAFEVGINAPSGDGDRRMTGPGGAALAYELYQDAARSVAWGEGGGSRPARAGNASADEPATLTVYGAVPSQVGAPPGEYLAQLQVTLSF